MTPLFAKLNFKHQKEVILLNQPQELEQEVRAMEAFTTFITKLSPKINIAFALIFVKSKSEIDTIAGKINNHISEDAILWFAFPKSASKKYAADINRDNGWEGLKSIGLETVRIVSIDEDWSALRFRKLEFIKKMTRKF